MNKPITLIIQETKTNFYNILNNTPLPPCVLELIVKDMLNEIHVLSKKQLQEDELVYMNGIQEKEVQTNQESSDSN